MDFLESYFLTQNYDIISCDKEKVDNLPGSGVKLSEVCKVD